MENLLNVYFDLLLKNNALNPLIIFSTKKNPEISIYDEDISLFISNETQKIIEKLDDYYFSCNDESEQSYFFDKFIFNIQSLGKICESRIESSLGKLKSDGFSDPVINEYSNIFIIYSSLKHIKNYLQISWCFLASKRKSLLDKICKKDFDAPICESNQTLDKEGQVCSEEVNNIITIGDLKINRNIPNKNIVEIHHSELISDALEDANLRNFAEEKIVWNGSPKDFVYLFLNPVEENKIFLEKGRNSKVKLLHEKFLILTEDKTPIQLSTLQGYFSKAARGDTF